MKKILEVLQYGENDIRFNTDVKNVEREFPELLTTISFNMATRLWGGNETAVLAMIRILAMADLSLSVNRKEMLRQLDLNSSLLAKSMQEARKDVEKRGGKILVVPPVGGSSKMKS